MKSVCQRTFPSEDENFLCRIREQAHFQIRIQDRCHVLARASFCVRSYVVDVTIMRRSVDMFFLMSASCSRLLPVSFSFRLFHCVFFASLCVFTCLLSLTFRFNRCSYLLLVARFFFPPICFPCSRS